MHADYTAGLCRLVEKKTTAKMEAGFVLECDNFDCNHPVTYKPTGLQWNHWGHFSTSKSGLTRDATPFGSVNVLCPSCHEWLQVATATAPTGAWNVQYNTDVVHR